VLRRQEGLFSPADLTPTFDDQVGSSHIRARTGDDRWAPRFAPSSGGIATFLATTFAWFGKTSEGQRRVVMPIRNFLRMYHSINPRYSRAGDCWASALRKVWS